MKDARKKALSIAMEAIEKNHGKGSVMRLGDQPHVKVDVIPTGSLSIDAAIGIGGVPRGRVDRDLRAGILRAKPRSACTLSPKRKSAAATRPLSMPSTRSM